jgi:ribosomal-protein-alanine N-acetyltransferase
VARNRRDDFDLQLVCLREDDAIVGYFALSQIFRGNFQSAYLGYEGSAPYGGRGLMSEGMELMLRRAFRDQRLHRVEANIQPGNTRSRALAERAGFHREGFSPRYLKIAGRWRDHERWAITVEDWRARARRR